MAKKLIKGAGFIEKAGTNYAGSTQDEANISEVLAGRAKWEDEAPAAGLAAASPTTPPATEAAAGGGGSAPLEGLASAGPGGGGMGGGGGNEAIAALHQAGDPSYIFRPGLGQRSSNRMSQASGGVMY